MRSLEDLLNSSEGRQFLQLEGVYTDLKEFRAHLQSPLLPNLNQTLNLNNNALLIHSGQQLYVDYRQSVLAKVYALQEFEQEPEINTLFIWADTDRSGSDKLIAKFKWYNREEPVRFAPDKTDAMEIRYVQIDANRLERAFDQLHTFVSEDKEHRESRRNFLKKLREAVFSQQHQTLATFNYKLTKFLFEHQLGYFPRSILQSNLINQTFLIEQVNHFLNQRNAVVHTFNAAIKELQHKEIDPQVTPIKEDFLPFFYTCPRDYRRLRLVHELEGTSHFATGSCKCGEVYRFYLGSNLLSMEELVAAGYWSLDVFFPLFMSDFSSGHVAGKSSALYGIVLNRVLEKALGKRPIPIYVPSNIGKNSGVDSLIYKYFHGASNS